MRVRVRVRARICACAFILATVSAAQPSLPGGGGGGRAAALDVAGAPGAAGGAPTFDGTLDGAAALGLRALPGLRSSHVALACASAGGASTLPKVPTVPSSSMPTWPEMMATALTWVRVRVEGRGLGLGLRVG